ncbi:four helix bundle protein [Nanoarchaeota archaeon]
MGRRHKNLFVYKLSEEILLDIYYLTKKYPDNEKTNFISQMRRAATSIVLNIVEGCARKSTKLLSNFFEYAYGSSKELKELINLSNKLDYITIFEYERMNKKIDILSAKLYLFLRSIEKDIGDKFYQSRNRRLNQI